MRHNKFENVARVTWSRARKVLRKGVTLNKFKQGSQAYETFRGQSLLVYFQTWKLGGGALVVEEKHEKQRSNYQRKKITKLKFRAFSPSSLALTKG